MSLVRPSVLFAALVAVPAVVVQAGAQTQTGTVAGRVVQAGTGAPVVGARVYVVGDTARGTVTRQDGQFTLGGVRAGARRLRVARIGFSAQEQPVTVAAGEAAALTVQLQATAVALSEVVAIGYGTQRRQDLTGSIASVTSEQLQQTAITSIEQGIQGRVPGVQITQGDAAPGGGLRVQIRGTNSPSGGSAEPLYVIDGVLVSTGGSNKRLSGSATNEDLTSLTETNPLSSIAPSDIESIDILKDASATAIYGSRGANGVVIITTKRGSRGSAGQFTFNVQQGVASVTRELDVLNAGDYARYVNKSYTNAYGAATETPYGGRAGSQTPEQIEQRVGAGTNWQDLIFRNATLGDYQLGFSGGEGAGTYSVTGNLLDQQGVILGSRFRRGGVRANLDRQVNAAVRLSTNLALTRSVNNMVRSSTVSGYRSVGVVRQAVTYTPFAFTDSARAALDPRAEDPTQFQQYGSNPLRYTDEVNESDRTTRGIGGLRVTSQLGRGFALDLNVGGNFERRNYGIYYPRTVSEGFSAGGNAIASGAEFANILSENLLRYNADLGAGSAHRVDAVAGYTYQNDRSTFLENNVQGFADDILGGNVLQNGTAPAKPFSDVNTAQLSSFLGRVNYTLRNRYSFTATLRADGSSRFAANNKWAAFPSAAVSWRAIDEPFLRERGPLSDLKFRLSYGRSGNQAVGPYQSLAAITGLTTTLGDAIVPAYATTRLANPDLRWETTAQYDAGVDFGAWSNRVTGTVDVYRKNTSDLLQAITLADNTGFQSAFINSGNVTNKGVEFQLGVDVLRPARARGLGWNVSANASHNVNRIVSLGPTARQFAGRLGAGGGLEVTPYLQEPGLAIGTLYGYRTDGLVRTAADSAAYSAVAGSAVRVGDVRYRDVDGDGTITAADQTVIGDANPDWTWGLANRVTYGRFDLSALVTAVRGVHVINSERLRYLELNGSINLPREYVTNAFDPATNPGGLYPLVRNDRRADARFSDRYIEDGSFVRLRNVQLGYNLTLPRARSARVYVNGINLLTSTKYSGFDPEVSAFGGSDRPGVDLGSYPQSRTVTVGINTAF